MGLVSRTQSGSDKQDERQRPRNLEGLVEALNDTSPAARRWAARDLAAHGASAPALCERLEGESDPAVREAILTALTEIGDETAVRGLARGLRSEDAALRNECIDAMKHLPDAVGPIMAELLSDPDPDVRVLAVNVLESLRHRDVERWLIDVVTRDAHVNVCGAAADLLAEVGSDAAAPALNRLPGRFPEAPYIAFIAELALKRIRQG